MLSNLGRLMRLCAQAVGGVETKLTGRRGEFTQEERGYFNKVRYCVCSSPFTLVRSVLELTFTMRDGVS